MRSMQRKDRSHYRVRKFHLGDPQQDYEPAIQDLSPTERIALVVEATRRMLAMKGQSFDEPRLPRHALRVEKRWR